ncbi:hypothetical protein BJ508DRAFT_320835 [Ascobolus immersus RN42]|uniref:Uncharacterized protein n=1 Tax=Ascobolus immersus RN42 TaxID=1160509 RepID=A0A3N4IUG4_ASCIM|nr:hypothetical protein BJ508DRAFT_320835 [Ascobolus immersus RN42]
MDGMEISHDIVHESAPPRSPEEYREAIPLDIWTEEEMAVVPFGPTPATRGLSSLNGPQLDLPFYKEQLQNLPFETMPLALNLPSRPQSNVHEPLVPRPFWRPPIDPKIPFTKRQIADRRRWLADVYVAASEGLLRIEPWFDELLNLLKRKWNDVSFLFGRTKVVNPPEVLMADIIPLENLLLGLLKTLDGPGSLVAALKSLDNSEKQREFLHRFGDYFAYILRRLKGAGMEWTIWDALTTEAKSTTTVPTCQCHIDVYKAAILLSISPSLLGWIIFEYGKRNLVSHTGISRLVEECAFHELGKKILEDSDRLRTLGSGEESWAIDHIQARRMLLLLQQEVFLSLSRSTNGRIKYRLTEAAECRAKRRAAKIKKEKEEADKETETSEPVEEDADRVEEDADRVEEDADRVEEETDPVEEEGPRAIARDASDPDGRVSEPMLEPARLDVGGAEEIDVAADGAEVVVSIEEESIALARSSGRKRAWTEGRIEEVRAHKRRALLLSEMDGGEL